MDRKIQCVMTYLRTQIRNIKRQNW